MSRVHDALRRSERSGGGIPGAGKAGMATEPGSLHGLLDQIKEVAWDPAAEAHIIDAQRPAEFPAEEFRSLRTRLNHMQGLSPLHTMVVTSASPAEGKSFTAANLAVAESHLQDNLTLLADFDFRRPAIHNLFKIDRAPGLSEYLEGKASLGDIIKKIAGTSLYVCPAGSAVMNPLELLNLKETRILLERLPTLFNWVILDTPPLLFAADANLLSTYCDGTLMVVRLGQTTIDSITRAIGGMSHNNVVGVVANAAKRGELYSKYTYYHSYYYYNEDNEGSAKPAAGEVPTAAAKPAPDED